MSHDLPKVGSLWQTEDKSLYLVVSVEQWRSNRNYVDIRLFFFYSDVCYNITAVDRAHWHRYYKPVQV